MAKITRGTTNGANLRGGSDSAAVVLLDCRLFSEFRAVVEELPKFVAVEGEVSELAAFENGGGEGDVGGLVEVGPPTEHSGGDGEECFFGAEAVDGSVDGAGDVFGAEASFPGFVGGGGFAVVEGEEAFFAEGGEEGFSVDGGEVVVGESGEALFVVSGGDAERAFGGDEEIGLPEADETYA